MSQFHLRVTEDLLLIVLFQSHKSSESTSGNISDSFGWGNRPNKRIWLLKGMTSIASPQFSFLKASYTTTSDLKGAVRSVFLGAHKNENQ